MNLSEMENGINNALSKADLSAHLSRISDLIDEGGCSYGVGDWNRLEGATRRKLEKLELAELLGTV